jgi:phosphatidylglycerophosphate synthase
MNSYPAKTFLMLCIISLILFGLIYFVDPNRNAQMATLILVKFTGGLTIIAVIIFIVARAKRRRNEEY